MMVQVRLQSGKSHRVCWLRKEDKPFKVGSFITLKDSEEPDRFWRVMGIGEPKELKDIYRGWNNNI